MVLLYMYDNLKHIYFGAFYLAWLKKKFCIHYIVILLTGDDDDDAEEDGDDVEDLEIDSDSESESNTNNDSETKMELWYDFLEGWLDLWNVIK